MNAITESLWFALQPPLGEPVEPSRLLRTLSRYELELWMRDVYYRHALEEVLWFPRKDHLDDILDAAGDLTLAEYEQDLLRQARRFRGGL
jgi:hypothetical protein